MKIAIWYDKNKPEVDLVYATTKNIDVELEKVVLDIEENENILEVIHTHLGLQYVEPQSDCGPDGCE